MGRCVFSETAITEPWVELEGEWWIEGDSVATTGSLLSVGEDGGSTQKSVTDVPSRFNVSQCVWYEEESLMAYLPD